jgi:integrase
MAYLKANFSGKFIAQLPAAQSGKRVYYSDLKQPGLLLCVTPTGTKSFQVYVKVKNRPIRVTLGRFNPSISDSYELPRNTNLDEYLSNNPELNVRIARELAVHVKGALKQGANPADAKRVGRAEKTLGEMFELYYRDHLLARQKKTADEVKLDFARYLGDLPPTPRLKHGQQRAKSPGSVNWQRRPLSSITKKDIHSLHSDLGNKSGHRTANKVLVLLKSIFNRAKDWDLYDKPNPVIGVQPFKLKSRDRFIQADELPRFFKSVLQEENPNVRDYVLLSLLTGARKTNVLSMRWEDINLEREVWHIKDTKNGDPLAVPLMPEAVQILSKRKPKSTATYVFEGSTKDSHMQDPRKGWQRIFDRDEVEQLAIRINEAGGHFEWPVKKVKKERDHSRKIETLNEALARARAIALQMNIDTHGTRLQDLRIHDMRRTLGSWQARHGASLVIIGKSLGHRSPTSTAIYSRLNLDPVKDSMLTATRAMLSVANLLPEAEITSIETAKLKRVK